MSNVAHEKAILKLDSQKFEADDFNGTPQSFTDVMSSITEFISKLEISSVILLQ